jgi:alpha-tubulin suppressor-like RCC1 family protein
MKYLKIAGFITATISLMFFMVYDKTLFASDVIKNGNKTMATGIGHSMVVKTGGNLWAWGYNKDGQLGDGTTIDRHIPVKIMDSVVSVSAGGNHTIAIKTDDSLWAWGYNYFGQLGDGTTSSLFAARPTPVKIMDLVVSVSAGGYHTMAIKADGSLWAWGRNKYGQLGDGTINNHSTPIKIMDLVASVSAGEGHTMAIKTDGSLWAWGLNESGELGDGTTTNHLAPVKIMDSALSVSAGVAHTMVIKADGSLWAWGSNWAGQLGDGTTISRHTPVKIMDSAMSVSSGHSHTVVIKTDGSLWAWGYNVFDEFGDRTTKYRSTPIKIMDSIVSVSAAPTEDTRTTAIKADGSLWAWGYNRYGELGDGTTVERSVPIKIMDGVMLPLAVKPITPAVKLLQNENN